MGVYPSFIHKPARYGAFILIPYFESGRSCKQWYDDVDVKDSRHWVLVLF